MTNNPEFILRVHCILKHCQQSERDGVENSLGHLRQIEQDARALEDLLLDNRTEVKIIHLTQGCAEVSNDA